MHLPRGKYLRQLAKGLMIGKISYAAAAVAIPRFDNECKGPNAAHRAVPVAIMTPPGASLDVRGGITSTSGTS
ncbi:Hypothetical protein FKW44_001092 [Caligus rogercresseyi]|uniref:Uncharacterized protein n=1 Tax=Caligus rogercresseyi TaxID=217165 RepID=A0A7T8KI97_CALRO|nr:Hypothetical protein FKW44_001092 [Caligus rogercresseyi]